MPQPDLEAQKRMIAVLEGAVQSAIAMEPRLAAVTILLTFSPEQTGDPKALNLTSQPGGVLTPEVAARVLADTATFAGDLTVALRKTAQEIDNELAARTRKAQEMADQQRQEEATDDGSASTPSA